MDAATVRALGFILACNARVEGMKAENMAKARISEPMAYDDVDFNGQAYQMERIAHELQG